MCPAEVYINNRLAGTITGVGSLDIPHPANLFAFGGRASYYGDTIPHAQIIGSEGDTIANMLNAPEESLSMTIDLTAIAPQLENPSYAITVKRTSS